MCWFLYQSVSAALLLKLLGQECYYAAGMARVLHRSWNAVFPANLMGVHKSQREIRAREEPLTLYIWKGCQRVSLQCSADI